MESETAVFPPPQSSGRLSGKASARQLTDPSQGGRRRQDGLCTDVLAETTLLWVLQRSTRCGNRKGLIWVKFSPGLQGWRQDLAFWAGSTQTA